jgi:hypothetical protein
MKPLPGGRGSVLNFFFPNRESERAAIDLLTPRAKAETIHY